MAERTFDEPRSAGLDRTIDLTRVSWTAIGMVAIFAVALFLRLPQLDHFPLSPVEAHRAGDAWRLFQGDTTGANNAVPRTSPSSLLLQALSFFLLGASDTAARIPAALLGLGMVILIFALRPLAGDRRTLGMAALAAISPTLVYSSRVDANEIVVAFFALLAIVAFLRHGRPAIGTAPRGRWAAVLGFALAAGFGAGASFLSVLLAVLIAFGALAFTGGERNIASRSFRSLRDSRESVIFLLVAFAVTLIALFSQVFTDFRALAGIGDTFVNWGRLLANAPNSTPTQFFLLAVLLYELVAVVFAVAAAIDGGRDEPGELPWSFFAIWFVASLLIFSFSSGGAPEHAVHVALPLVLLGGSRLGIATGAFLEHDSHRGRSWLSLLVLFGLVAGSMAVITLIGRIDEAVDQNQAVFEAIAAAIISVIPLAYAAYLIARSRRADGIEPWIGRTLLLAVAVFLVGFGFRSAVLLSFYNASSGTELLAQRTSTLAVHAIVQRVTNLSRDTTLHDGTAADPQGGHGVTIAVDRSVQWPYRWYFRDFPNFTITADGQASHSGAQVVISASDAGMAEAGYTPRTYRAQTRVPGRYLSPQIGNIVSHIVKPSLWRQGVHFLLFRNVAIAEPATVAVGLTGDLANQISPNTGPFGLFDHVGAGSGRGQFNQPRGIAASPDGSRIFVVDMGNARVEQFDVDGAFVSSWGGGEIGDVQFNLTDQGLGPTGIAVGPDGLVYVCDTWNHRVVVLDSNGQMVREFGSFADTQDSSDPTVQPGMFFGPRAIAIVNDQIFVVDTGNERVQVFAADGTFLRAFGGRGTEPDHLIEPVGIAIGPDGNVYVADSSNARISVFSTTGTPVKQIPVDVWRGHLYFEPYLTFDLFGNLYATSSATGSVEVFDANGDFITSMTSVGTNLLQQPVGIATEPDGTVLITDKGTNGVYRYEPTAALVPPGGSNEQPAEVPASPAASPFAPTPTVEAKG